MSDKPKPTEAEKSLAVTFADARGIPGHFEALLVRLAKAIRMYRDGDRNRVALQDIEEYMGTIARKFSNHPRAAEVLKTTLEKNFALNDRIHLCTNTISDTAAGSAFKTMLAGVGLATAKEYLESEEFKKNKADRYQKVMWDLSNLFKDTDIGSALELEIGTTMLTILPDLWRLRDDVEAEYDSYPADTLEIVAKRVVQNPYGPLKDLLIETTDELAKLYQEEMEAGEPIKHQKKKRSGAAPAPAAE